MKRFGNFYVLMDKAGDGAGSGGGSGDGGGSGGAAPNGGGGPSLTGGNGSAGNGTGQGGASAGNGGGSPPPEVKIPDNWKSALPQELQEDPALKAINDVGALAKSYLNAQKLVGADKIVIPGKHATEEDWKAVYAKLGLPSKVEDYKVELGKEAAIDAKFLDAFRAEAHKAGILPQQALKLAQWFDTTNKQISTDIQKAQAAHFDNKAKELQKEWGQAYETKMARAQAAFGHFADPETIDYLNKTGLSQDTNLIKLFEKIAGVLDEDKIPAGARSGGGFVTPAEAKTEIGRIMADTQHPYHLRDHPNHKVAVQEVSKLFEAASGKRA